MVHFISARLLVVAVTTWWTLSISSGIGLVNAEPQHLRSTRYGEQDQREAKQQRNLNTNNKAAAAAPYYHTISTDTLGTPNPDAAIGNPLKGLVENPVYTNPPYPPDLPVAVEFHYLEFNKIMLGNPKVLGEEKAINWKYLEDTLAGSASRNNHAVWRVIVEFQYHWSGNNFFVPQYLIDAGLDMQTYDNGKLKTPNYGDPILLEAIEQFITLSGKRYNGDKRLGFVQCGLLGHWGEWHGPFLPDSSKDKVIGWFAASYPKTQIQVRYPNAAAFAAGFGRHDDSFTFETLDGAANGGVQHDYYYWPNLVKAGQADSWKRGSIGGETRSENQETVFENSYPGRQLHKQSFMECVNVTHTTWMFHHNAFKSGGYIGTELANARYAHARMGYNFHFPTISAKSTTTGQVDVDVTVTQTGVAPFYYDLNLALQCPGMTKKTLPGVNTIIDNGTSKVFGFTTIPATTACLGALSLALESSYGYTGRPIKFAQGKGTISFNLPLPGPTVPTAPSSVSSPKAPVTIPGKAPAKSPASAPIKIPATAPISLAPMGTEQMEATPSKLISLLKRIFRFLSPR